MKKYLKPMLFAIFFLVLLGIFAYITYQYFFVRYNSVRQLCGKEAATRSKNIKRNEVNPDDYEGMLINKQEEYYRECMQREWNFNRILGTVSGTLQ